MSHWMGRNEQKMPVDFEVLQESALAMAQATLQNAMDASGLKRSELAEKMSRPRSYLSRMLSGSHNLTIKTFALALAACGFEAKFEFTPIRWGWAQSSNVTESVCEEAVPTDGGQFYSNGHPALIAMELPIGAMAP